MSLYGGMGVDIDVGVRDRFFVDLSGAKYQIFLLWWARSASSTVPVSSAFSITTFMVGLVGVVVWCNGVVFWRRLLGKGWAIGLGCWLSQPMVHILWCGRSRGGRLLWGVSPLLIRHTVDGSEFLYQLALGGREITMGNPVP